MYPGHKSLTQHHLLHLELPAPRCSGLRTHSSLCHPHVPPAAGPPRPSAVPHSLTSRLQHSLEPELCLTVWITVLCPVKPSPQSQPPVIPSQRFPDPVRLGASGCGCNGEGRGGSEAARALGGSRMETLERNTALGGVPTIRVGVEVVRPDKVRNQINGQGAGQ